MELEYDEENLKDQLSNAHYHTTGTDPSLNYNGLAIGLYLDKKHPDLAAAHKTALCELGAELQYLIEQIGEIGENPLRENVKYVKDTLPFNHSNRKKEGRMTLVSGDGPSGLDGRRSSHYKPKRRRLANHYVAELADAKHSDLLNRFVEAWEIASQNPAAKRELVVNATYDALVAAAPYNMSSNKTTQQLARLGTKIAKYTRVIIDIPGTVLTGNKLPFSEIIYSKFKWPRVQKRMTFNIVPPDFHTRHLADDILPESPHVPLVVPAAPSAPSFSSGTDLPDIPLVSSLSQYGLQHHNQVNAIVDPNSEEVMLTLPNNVQVRMTFNDLRSISTRSLTSNPELINNCTLYTVNQNGGLTPTVNQRQNTPLTQQQTTVASSSNAEGPENSGGSVTTSRRPRSL